MRILSLWFIINIDYHVQGVDTAMLDFVKNELLKLNIDTISCLSLDECEITRPHLLEKTGITNGSVIIFAVPYLTPNCPSGRNVSSYAISKDYHIFFKDLFSSLIGKLQQKYPDNIFVGFADHSPINEISAAAKAGLGIIGVNHLLITEKYSSYVFIGELITDAVLPSYADEIKHYINCKKCVLACPVHTNVDSCLSAITQKKGDLKEYEIAQIKKSGCAWGCDICQEACPYTEKAIQNNTIYTSIEFFKTDLTPTLTNADIDNMSDELFSQRAYSWRGKKVISRNLKILEEKEN